MRCYDSLRNSDGTTTNMVTPLKLPCSAAVVFLCSFSCTILALIAPKSPEMDASNFWEAKNKNKSGPEPHPTTLPSASPLAPTIWKAWEDPNWPRGPNQPQNPSSSQVCQDDIALFSADPVNVQDMSDTLVKSELEYQKYSASQWYWIQKGLEIILGTSNVIIYVLTW